jgi:hypothetical protein
MLEGRPPGGGKVEAMRSIPVFTVLLALAGTAWPQAVTPPAQGGAERAQAVAPRVELARLVARDPVLLEALAARNARPESDETIQRKDQEWQANRNSALRKEITGSSCSARLRELLRADPIIVEAFLMDAKGALVCSTVETSDYWQGDEAKWQRTYRDGLELFVDEPALDMSTGTYAVQLSVPASSGGRKAGALTLTLKFPRRQEPGTAR